MHIVKCTKCRRQLKFKREVDDKRIKCKYCGNIFVNQTGGSGKPEKPATVKPRGSARAARGAVRPAPAVDAGSHRSRSSSASTRPSSSDHPDRREEMKERRRMMMEAQQQQRKKNRIILLSILVPCVLGIIIVMICVAASSDTDQQTADNGEQQKPVAPDQPSPPVAGVPGPAPGPGPGPGPGPAPGPGNVLPPTVVPPTGGTDTTPPAGGGKGSSYARVVSCAPTDNAPGYFIGTFVNGMYSVFDADAAGKKINPCLDWVQVIVVTDAGTEYQSARYSKILPGLQVKYSVELGEGETPASHYCLSSAPLPSTYHGFNLSGLRYTAVGDNLVISGEAKNPFAFDLKNVQIVIDIFLDDNIYLGSAMGQLLHGEDKTTLKTQQKRSFKATFDTNNTDTVASDFGFRVAGRLIGQQ